MDDLVLSPGPYLEQGVSWLNRNHGDVFRALSVGVDNAVRALEGFLINGPNDLWGQIAGQPAPAGFNAVFVIALVALLALRISGWKLALFVVLGLGFCYLADLWSATMRTTALVGVSTLIALSIAIPLGIAAGLNPRLERVLRPVLDLMQTLPPWVYLIPAVILLSVGRAPAVLATVVYAIPPALRLTALGMRKVPKDRIELGYSLGATPLQILFKIRLPMALPSIMVGVNQCILLSLGMVVIAGLIGAGGLGGEVTRGLSRMMLGLGFRAGLAVVILAIILDRLTQAMVRQNGAR